MAILMIMSLPPILLALELDFNQDFSPKPVCTNSGKFGCAQGMPVAWSRRSKNGGGNVRQLTDVKYKISGTTQVTVKFRRVAVKKLSSIT